MAGATTQQNLGKGSGVFSGSLGHVQELVLELSTLALDNRSLFSRCKDRLFTIVLMMMMMMVLVLALVLVMVMV